MANDVATRSWFCVLNNPAEHGFTGSESEIADQMVDRWMEGHPQRSCAVAYCISAAGLHHCHAVFEDTKVMRFTVVKKLFPGMHIEPTKGTKEQAEDYINKRGKFEEKGEQVLYIARSGEIKGAQGQRKDLEVVEDLLNQGLTPNQIFACSFRFRRYESMIRSAYFQRLYDQTPVQRHVSCYWHVGESGSGKSYERVRLLEDNGPESVYVVSDYEHGFDKYQGEPILFLDEFRGQLRYSVLLQLLDKFKVQVACRYSNVYTLWNEAHIASVLPPELVYQKMVQDNPSIDSFKQLMRRLNFIVYHYVSNGQYCSFTLPASEYIDYAHLREAAEAPPEQLSIPDWCRQNSSESL